MNIGIVSFTRKGALLCSRLESSLNENYNCTGFTLKKFSKETGLRGIENLSSWTETMFKKGDALVFVGACGIAVRSIAPYIVSKTVDPAVIVIDEMGKHVIPILSGHIGGANDLALKIALITHGTPVISTATDINGRFSVDSFSVKNNLYIENMNTAKMISGKVLEGEKIGFNCDEVYKGNIHKDLTLNKCETGISISIYNKKPYENTLHLIPRIVSLGIGCRKGTLLKDIEYLALKTLEENNISINSVKNICSINIKENEKGIIDFSKKINVDFVTFSPEELNGVKGEFTSSSFVKGVTGVDNVCERAAVMGSNGELIVKKTSRNGVTIAVAKNRWVVDFEN